MNGHVTFACLALSSPKVHLSPSVLQDIRKCLTALDQLSMVYVTCKHVQRHSELVSTLRKVKR